MLFVALYANRVTDQTDTCMSDTLKILTYIMSKCICKVFGDYFIHLKT